MLRKIVLFVFASILLLHPILIADTNVADRQELHFVHDTNLFPIPEALEPQVNFWVNIYSKYSLNQHVIHDSRNLSVIYEVFDIRDLVGDKKVSYRTMRRYVKRRISHWKSILRQLSSHRTNFDHLKGDQKKAFEVWGEKRDHRLYRAASRRIRAQRGQKERFRKGVQLSGRYLIYMKKVFRDMGLPEGLTAIPHVESSFNYQAYSKVGAAGIWQFTRHTGRLFLKISYEVDERLDPILATHAAAELLQKNYNELGNWPLAITAYNHGLQGVKRAKRILHTDNIAVIIQKYRSRKFKFASRNFYTEFLAALKVVGNYEKYLGPVIYDPPIQFREFELPAYISMSTLVRYFGLPKEVIREFNPALRPPVYVDNKYLPKGYKLRLPRDLNGAALFAKIPDKELHTRQKRLKWYRVRRGDTVGRIARRFHLRTNDVILANNIRNVRRIRRGSILYIPSKYESPREAPPGKTIATKKKKPVRKVVKRPDTLVVQAAARKDTTQSQSIFLASSNSDDLYGPFLNEPPANEKTRIDTVGRTLPTYEVTMTKTSKPETGWIRVEPGETLGHYADWLGIPTQRVRRWNGLSYRQYLQIGQRIKLRFETVSATDFEEKRLEYHRSIEEDFFQNYEIVGTQVHKVRRGENIWYLCNYVYDLPYWLVKSYNGNRNLFQLHPGDEIIVPKVESKNPDNELSQSD